MSNPIHRQSASHPAAYDNVARGVTTNATGGNGLRPIAVSSPLVARQSVNNQEGGLSNAACGLARRRGPVQPARAAEGARNVSQVKPNERSVNATQSPINTNQRPINTNQRPINANQSLANANQRPINANQSPINANQSPINANQSPINASTNGTDQGYGAGGEAASRADANMGRLLANGGMAVTLDRKASNSVSRMYILEDVRSRKLAIAPVDEALARMRGSCGGDEDLMNRVVEHMQRYYEQHCLSGSSKFSNNPYLQKLQANTLANFRAHAKGDAMPFEIDRANILAHRFCHPGGKVDKTIMTILGMMSKADLVDDVSRVVTLTASATNPKVEQSSPTPTAQPAMGRPQSMGTARPTPATVPTATAPRTLLSANVPATSSPQAGRPERASRVPGPGTRIRRRAIVADERESEERPRKRAAGVAHGAAARATDAEAGFANMGTLQPDQRTGNWFRM